MTFKEYHFKSYINEALNSINFVNPTKVQEIVIPEAISGTSLMVESATGSGKTHAFLLPILENLDEDKISEYFTNNFQGDCLLAVGDEELIKIHFHTNEPWKVLEYCSQLGEIYDVVIEDMDRQARGLKG